jgi:hypothetical protein
MFSDCLTFVDAADLLRFRKPLVVVLVVQAGSSLVLEIESGDGKTILATDNDLGVSGGEAPGLSARMMSSSFAAVSPTYDGVSRLVNIVESLLDSCMTMLSQ